MSVSDVFNIRSAMCIVDEYLQIIYYGTPLLHDYTFQIAEYLHNGNRKGEWTPIAEVPIYPTPLSSTSVKIPANLVDTILKNRSFFKVRASAVDGMGVRTDWMESQALSQWITSKRGK